jgi:hypothetical protein
MTIRFACGHTMTCNSDVKEAPVCPTCGEHRISHVDAPKPRITIRTTP